MDNYIESLNYRERINYMLKNRIFFYVFRDYYEIRYLRIEEKFEYEKEYYKMLAFRYEFSNNFQYTEEELKYYRERFNDYYQFKE